MDEMLNSLNLDKRLHTANISSIEIELYKLLFEEWKYRLTQYWSLTIKSTTFSFALIFLPFLYGYFGIDEKYIINLPVILFPITGLGIATITVISATMEMTKINRIKTTLKSIIKRYYPKLSPAVNAKRFWFHQNMPIVIFITQLIIGLIIIFIICSTTTV